MAFCGSCNQLWCWVAGMPGRVDSASGSLVGEFFPDPDAGRSHWASADRHSHYGSRDRPPSGSDVDIARRRAVSLPRSTALTANQRRSGSPIRFATTACSKMALRCLHASIRTDRHACQGMVGSVARHLGRRFRRLHSYCAHQTDSEFPGQPTEDMRRLAGVPPG